MRLFLSRIAGPSGGLAGFSLMSAGNLLVAVLTYFRQAEIARLFGTSWMTDAYAVALVFPMFAQQVVSHAFGSSFIPIYTDVLHKKGREAADRLASRILCWMAALGGILILLLLHLSGSLVSVAGPGLRPEVLDLSSTMLEIMLPIMLLVSASGILTGLTSCQKRFGIVSAVNVSSVAVSLLFVLLGHGRFGIMVLPLSGLAGAVTAFFVSLLAAIRYGLRFQPAMDTRDQDFRRLLRLSAPVVAGVMLGFLGPIVDKILASFLADSSVTAMDYAIRVRDMVLALLFLPISALSDVGFSEKSARNDMVAFNGEMASMLDLTSFLMLPAACLLSVFSTELVSVLFMRGSFGRESAELVGYALAYYAPWLAQFGFGAVVSRGFYALKDSKTPVLIGIWGMTANILLNIILIMPMGIGGLALSSTLSSTAKTLLLVWFFRRKSPDISFRPVLREHARLLAAAAALIGTALLMTRILPPDPDAGLAARIARILLWTVPSAGVYLWTCMLLGSASVRAFSEKVLHRGTGG